MEFLVNILLSSFFFVFVYQILAPRFSGGAVAFREETNLGGKLLFGVGMSIAVTFLQFFMLIAGFSAIVALSVGAQAGPVGVFIAGIFIVALMVGLTQLAYWIATLVLGSIMPSIIRVDGARAAFKAAWAPTIITSIFYSALIFLLFSMLAMGIAAVH